MTEKRPQSGYMQGRVHVLPVRIYYEETDFTGIVYHANYLKFFERGRTDFLRTIGIHHKALWALDPPLAFAIRSIHLDFQKPAEIDDILEVHTQYKKVSGASIWADQAIKRDGNDLVTASVHAVCINREGRPRRAPLTIREALTPYLGEENHGVP